MAALAVFEAIGKVVDSDFLALEILPILWNFALGPLLNLQQFQSYLTLIKSLSTRVETEHTRKLQELSTSNPATSTSPNDFPSRPASAADLPTPPRLSGCWPRRTASPRTTRA